MAALSPQAASIITWGARAVSHLQELAIITEALSRSEFRVCQLQEELTDAKAAAGDTAVRDARYESLVSGLVAAVAEAGLVWNDEASAVENVSRAFAWLKLATETAKSKVAEEEDASTFASVDHRLKLSELEEKLADTEAARAALYSERQGILSELRMAEGALAEDEQQREDIRKAVWSVVDLPYEPSQTFAWNVVNVIETLHRRAKAPTHAARDLARLLDALGAPDASVALRKLEGAKRLTVPLSDAPLPNDAGEKACRSCKGAFTPRSRAGNRRYCYICRPDWRDKREQLEFGDDEEPSPVPKFGGAACASCVHGKPNKHSDIGYECLIERARECLPLVHAKYLERA